MSHEKPQPAIHLPTKPSTSPSARQVLTPEMMKDISVDNTNGMAITLYFAGSLDMSVLS